MPRSVTIYVAPPTGVTHVVPLGTTTVNGAVSPYDVVQPGDTLLLEPGTRGRIEFTNLVGTLAQPINITNNGGVVNIVSSAGNYAAFRVRGGSKHLRALFNNVSSQCGSAFPAASQQPGLKLSGADRGIGVHELSEHVEVGYFEVFDTAGNPGVHVAEQLRSAVALQSGLKFHHFYIHDIFDSEGFYIGSSFWVDGIYTELDGCQVEYGLLEDIDYDGIQIGSVAFDSVMPNRCSHNVVRRSGIGTNAGTTHDKGIILNRGTIRCDVTHNWVEDATGPGIYDQGLGGNDIWNNVVVDPGTTKTSGDNNGTCIRVQAGNGVSGATHVLANTLIRGKGWGVNYGRTLDASVIRNNVCAENPLGAVNNSASSTSANNYTSTVAGAGFVNAAADDFHLAAGSACLNAGADLTSFGVTDDYDGVARPQSGGWDQGAYERPG